MSNSDSDVEVVPARKRKANVIEDFASDDEDSGSDDEDDESGEDDDESDDEESGDEDVDNDVDELTDDVSGDQCAICLTGFTDQLLGIPDNCAHVFCSVCILEWSKNVNTCPVDRKVYHRIIIRKREDGPDIDKVEVEDRSQEKEEYEDPTACEICGIGDREDTMLLCDGCDRGFHLECLTPALDTVPEDEWFCPECFADLPSRESEGDSQLYDDELLSISQEASGVPTQRDSVPCPRSSTSRRARTVATTRRRRRRTTTRRSRSSKRGRSSQRSSRPSSKRGTSSKGSSSSSSSKKGTKTKRRKVKKRRRRKKRKRTHKVKADQTDGQPRNDSRYVFPHEMEPTVSFNLFGSDFDLEYLPVVHETRTTATKPDTKKPVPSSSTTTDVLSSIFTNLDTLHDKDITLDRSGRLNTSKDAETTTSRPQDLEDPQKDKASTSKEDDSSSPASNSQNIRALSEINRKRILYFEKATAKPQMVKTFNTIFGQGGAKTEPLKSTTSDVPKRTTRTIGEKSSKRKTSKGYSTKTTSLASYKIPRKKSSGPEETSSVNSVETKSLPVEKSEKRVTQVPSSSSDGGILHLLPEATREVNTKERKTTINDGASTSKTRISKSRSEGSRSDSKDTSVTSPKERRHPTDRSQNTPKSTDNRQTFIKHNEPSCFTPWETQQDNRLSKDTSKNASHPSSSKASDESSPTSYQTLAGIKYSNKQSAPILGAFIQQIPIVGLPSLPILQTQPKSSSNDGLKPTTSVKTQKHPSNTQTATNLHLINTIKKQKTTLAGDFSENVQGQASVVPCGSTVVSQAKLLPPLKSPQSGSFQRPVAVVYPTKQGESASTSSLDAAKRRKEGIERLQRNQEIQDEVKKALKLFYNHKEIDKEQYKCIFKRAVKKIQESTAPIEPRGVLNLIRGYVKKIKGQLLQ